MSHFEGLEGNEGMGLDELFQNPNNSPDGAGLYNVGEVDNEIL